MTSERQVGCGGNLLHENVISVFLLEYQSSCSNISLLLQNISLLARSNYTFCIYTEYKEKESSREAHKVVAEAHKVVAEARKEVAEARKIVVKAQKVP